MKSTGSFWTTGFGAGSFDLVYYRGLNYVETAAVLQTSVESEKEDIRKTMVSLKPRHLKSDE